MGVVSSLIGACGRSPRRSGVPRSGEGAVIYISEGTKADVTGAPGTEFLLGRKKVWVEVDKGGKMALIEGLDKFQIAPQS